MAIYSWFSHWKWWFSIVMLVYQRVIHYVRGGSFVLEIQDHLNSLVTLDALRASWTSMNKVACCRWRTLSSIAGTWRTTTGLPSGKLTVRYWKWPFIVDLPIQSMVIFHSYVSLPEGTERREAIRRSLGKRSVPQQGLTSGTTTKATSISSHYQKKRKRNGALDRQWKIYHYRFDDACRCCAPMCLNCSKYVSFILCVCIYLSLFLSFSLHLSLFLFVSLSLWTLTHVNLGINNQPVLELGGSALFIVTDHYFRDEVRFLTNRAC